MLIKILLLIILIIINGIFSATEIAFLSINKYKLNLKIKQNDKKALSIANLINDSSTFLSAIQVAITLSGFLSSAFAADAFATKLASMIDIPFLSETVQINILIVLITIILSYFTLVFGELLPKKIGIAYPEKICFAMIGVINVVIVIFKPFIKVLTFSTNILEKLFKIKQEDENIEEELKDKIIDSNLEELEKKLLLNVFEFNDVKVKDVMTKKEKVIYIDINDTKEEILKKITKYKYTRFPIMDKDKVIGMLNIKDIILNKDTEFNIKNYIRKVEIFDSNMIIDDAYLLLNSNYEALAVVKEKNELLGIVTIEDILEHIVGNVFDEYDTKE